MEAKQVQRRPVLSEDPAMADGIRALAVAVITQALRDALRGQSEAREWVLTVAPTWFDALGHTVTSEDLDRFMCSQGASGQLAHFAFRNVPTEREAWRLIPGAG